jgi:putative drug exporter of the RND superfamily
MKIMNVCILEVTMNQLGGFIYRYRKWTLAIWILIILGFGFFALKLSSVLSGNGFEFDGMYKETRHILEEEFGHPKSSIIVLFEREKTISDEQWTKFLNANMETAKQVASSDRIISPFERDEMLKERFAYGLITFDKDAGILGEEIKKLKKNLTNEKGLNATLTGEPVIVKDLNEASQKDLAKAEMIGLPIALVILVLSFGGIIAAGIPLVIGIISILVTMGIVYFFSYSMDLSIFILNIVPMIGLALSIDFALLFINRYKEELKEKNIQDAIQVTVSTAGRSIIFSGLCVFIGLSGLLFIEIDIFQNVAIGGMTVVFVSVLSALTFLPAILSMIGEKINSLSVWSMKETSENVWKTFAILVMKKPIFMVIGALAILLTGLLPAKDMNLAIPGLDALPEKYPSRIAFETFQKHFISKEKSDTNKVVIILESNGRILDKNQIKDASNIIDNIKKNPLVVAIDSPFAASGLNDATQFSEFITKGNSLHTKSILDYFIRDEKMLLNVYLKEDIESSTLMRWVREWSEKDLGMKAYFGGSPKFEQEIFDEIFTKAPYGLLLILISTFIILMAAFRSLLIPIKAIIMNMLSLGATFGIVVWIYQQGHFGMEPVDIALILPVFVFSLVFGLSMDYEVFLISRIQEFYLKTGNNSESTIAGLTSTSKIITSAAAIMIVVTGAFAFTGVMPVKQLGVGIAIAIFIDATIIRMILVPALMKLLGDWNWWFFGINSKKQLGKN